MKLIFEINLTFSYTYKVSKIKEKQSSKMVNSKYYEVKCILLKIFLTSG